MGRGRALAGVETEASLIVGTVRLPPQFRYDASTSARLKNRSEADICYEKERGSARGT